MSDVDPEAVSEAPIIAAVEGLVLSVETDAGIEMMPALAIHLLSSRNDEWTQTVLINRSMVERLQASVLPSLITYIDSHTKEGP